MRKPGLYKIYAWYEWQKSWGPASVGGYQPERLFPIWHGKLVSNTLTITIKK